MSLRDEKFLDYYALLDVSSKADVASINEAYRRLIKLCHPDRAKGKSSEEAEAEIKRLTGVIETFEPGFAEGKNVREEITKRLNTASGELKKNRAPYDKLYELWQEEAKATTSRAPKPKSRDEALSMAADLSYRIVVGGEADLEEAFTKLVEDYRFTEKELKTAYDQKCKVEEAKAGQQKNAANPSGMEVDDDFSASAAGVPLEEEAAFIGDPFPEAARVRSGSILSQAWALASRLSKDLAKEPNNPQYVAWFESAVANGFLGSSWFYCFIQANERNNGPDRRKRFGGPNRDDDYLTCLGYMNHLLDARADDEHEYLDVVESAPITQSARMFDDPRAKKMFLRLLKHDPHNVKIRLIFGFVSALVDDPDNRVYQDVLDAMIDGGAVTDAWISNFEKMSQSRRGFFPSSKERVRQELLERMRAGVSGASQRPTGSGPAGGTRFSHSGLGR